MDSKFRRVKVEVRRSGTNVRHRSGYLALPLEVAKGDSALADLARAALDATAIGLIVNAEGSNVGIKVDGGGITLRPSGNLFDVAIEILIAHSMPNGELVKSFDKTLNLQLSREQRDQILQEGFTMSRTVDVRPSATALHVVVRDAASGGQDPSPSPSRKPGNTRWRRDCAGYLFVRISASRLIGPGPATLKNSQRKQKRIASSPPFTDRPEHPRRMLPEISNGHLARQDEERPVW